MTADDAEDLDSRLALLLDRLRELGSVLVAFSGGADSAFVLAAAARALGAERVVAATAVSASLPAAERNSARSFAEDRGLRHVEVPTHEMGREGYAANAGNRCYFCKSELLDVLLPAARDCGMAHVATGTNADDAVAGFRPGIRAAAERGAVTPLLDAGLTKAQVREASRRWGLSTWDKPAAACLSSRVAYGIRITPDRLTRVERAEVALRVALAAEGLTSPDVRVRDLGDSGRIEVGRDIVDVVSRSQAVLDAVRGAGFTDVEVDPRGFRSGSMNELLPVNRNDVTPYRIDRYGVTSSMRSCRAASQAARPGARACLRIHPEHRQTKADRGQHRGQVHPGRERVAPQQHGCHGDEGGQRANENQDGSDPDQPLTRPPGVTHAPERRSGA